MVLCQPRIPVPALGGEMAAEAAGGRSLGTHSVFLVPPARFLRLDSISALLMTDRQSHHGHHVTPGMGSLLPPVSHCQECGRAATAGDPQAGIGMPTCTQAPHVLGSIPTLAPIISCWVGGFGCGRGCPNPGDRCTDPLQGDLTGISPSLLRVPQASASAWPWTWRAGTPAPSWRAGAGSGARRPWRRSGRPLGTRRWC